MSEITIGDKVLDAPTGEFGRVDDIHWKSETDHELVYLVNGHIRTADELELVTPAPAPAADEQAGEGISYADAYWEITSELQSALEDVEGDFALSGKRTDVVKRLVTSYNQQASELADLRAKLAAARDTLNMVSLNAPQSEPAATDVWKWTYWFAGQQAAAALRASDKSQQAK